MAVKNLKPGAGFASRGNLRSKGVDMTPVKIGDLNNQVIPQVNSEITAINTVTTKNSQRIEENTETAGLAIVTANLAGAKVAKSCTNYATCAEAASGGVAAGELFSLVKTFKIQNGEETQDCSIPVVVCMPLSCEGTCW